MINILVTGSNGQLGTELKIRAAGYPDYNFEFIDIDELNLTDKKAVISYLKTRSYKYCINCAAFTAVDQAESKPDLAFLVNAGAVQNLIEGLKDQKTRMIHISTDYVFNGTASRPYHETDQAEPVNTYGRSKLEGEKRVLSYPYGMVIRTAWLYSSHGNNFLKTVLSKCDELPAMRIVDDQTGTPTWAGHLAEAILLIIRSAENQNPPFQKGIFHFANEGSCSWYDFALAIKQKAKLPCRILPVPTRDYPLPAKRPARSILDKSKFKNTFQTSIPDWMEGLEECLKKMNN